MNPFSVTVNNEEENKRAVAAMKQLGLKRFQYKKFVTPKTYPVFYDYSGKCVMYGHKLYLTGYEVSIEELESRIPAKTETLTVEEFYAQGNWPELDKHDRKMGKFSYYDMLDFAESYAEAKLVEHKRQLDETEAKKNEQIHNQPIQP